MSEVRSSDRHLGRHSKNCSFQETASRTLEFVFHQDSAGFAWGLLLVFLVIATTNRVLSFVSLTLPSHFALTPSYT